MRVLYFLFAVIGEDRVPLPDFYSSAHNAFGAALGHADGRCVECYSGGKLVFTLAASA